MRPVKPSFFSSIDWTADAVLHSFLQDTSALFVSSPAKEETFPGRKLFQLLQELNLGVYILSATFFLSPSTGTMNSERDFDSISSLGKTNPPMATWSPFSTKITVWKKRWDPWKHLRVQRSKGPCIHLKHKYHPPLKKCAGTAVFGGFPITWYRT